jgi:protein-tyrosine phosphatase
VDGTAWPGERGRNGGVDEVPVPEGPGRLWLCGKHFVGPDVEDALRRVGATTVVCLNERDELVDRYPGYVGWLGQNQPERAVWHPVPDLHAPELDAAERLLAGLRRRLAVGEGLLVHCGAGIGRAGTIAAGLLITMGISPAMATATVAAHRPMAGPEAGAQADLLVALGRERRLPPCAPRSG